MPPFDIPGYNFVGEVDLSDECFFIGAGCFAWWASSFPIPDPVDIGCIAAEGGCLTLEGVTRLPGCDTGVIWVYKAAWWNIFGPSVLIFPACEYPGLSLNSNESIDADM